jgi:hypothetical protein
VLIFKGRIFTWVYNNTCFSHINQAYDVTVLGLISSADKTTCSLLAVAAVTLITSLSATTSGAESSSDVPLAEIALTLKRLKTASSVSVIVTVIVSALPESSDTIIDFTTAVVADGTVYNVVALVLVKSTFLFTNVLAKEISLRLCFFFQILLKRSV